MSQSPVEWLNNEIKKRYGTVKRSRGCYLYTEKGVRLTDCYLDNGRAILGWGGGKAQTAFKDVFEKGANGFYQLPSTKKLENAVKTFLPENYSTVRFFQDETVAGAVLTSGAYFDKAGKSGEACPAGKNFAAKGTSGGGSIQGKAGKGSFLELWRPWLDFSVTVKEMPTGYPELEIYYPRFRCSRKNASEMDVSAFPEIIEMVPPFPYATTLKIYAFRDDLVKNIEIPESDVIPAPLAAAFTRSLWDLKIDLGKYSDDNFKAYTRQLEPFFQRKMCYLFSKIPENQYRDFVLACLDRGIIISPDFYVPSIVPWKANPGDIKKLASAWEQ